MSSGGEICRAALAAGVLLEEVDGDLRLRSLTGKIDPDLRELLRAGKDDVLVFLRWRAGALAELSECLERLERSYAGAPLGDDEIAAAEERMTMSFWAEDARGFSAALRDWRLAIWRAASEHRADGQESA